MTTTGDNAAKHRHKSITTEAPHLRIDWRNLVALCSRHHIPGKVDKRVFKYVPTVGLFRELHPHDEVYEQAKKFVPEKLEPTSIEGDGRQFVSTSNAAALRRAMDFDVNELLKGI